jgi:NAD dependent epimerase/dehydratase family enzyme
VSPANVYETARSRGVRLRVTGGTGFTGPHLIHRLSGVGADVHLVSRRPRPGHEHRTWHVTDLINFEWPEEMPPLVGANQVAAVNRLTAVAKPVSAARFARPVDLSRSRIRPATSQLFRRTADKSETSAAG